VSDTENFQTTDSQITGAQTTEAQTTKAQTTKAEPSGEANALLSRLRLIEDQPLESRAVAFAQIHEELQSRLDSPDAHSGA
jgi:hypothetical protein